MRSTPLERTNSRHAITDPRTASCNFGDGTVGAARPTCRFDGQSSIAATSAAETADDRRAGSARQRRRQVVQTPVDRLGLLVAASDRHHRALNASSKEIELSLVARPGSIDSMPRRVTTGGPKRVKTVAIQQTKCRRKRDPQTPPSPCQADSGVITQCVSAIGSRPWHQQRLIRSVGSRNAPSSCSARSARVWRYASASRASFALPIPSTSRHADAGKLYLLESRHLYRRQTTRNAIEKIVVAPLDSVGKKLTTAIVRPVRKTEPRSGARSASTGAGRAGA